MPFSIFPFVQPKSDSKPFPGLLQCDHPIERLLSQSLLDLETALPNKEEYTPRKFAKNINCTLTLFILHAPSPHPSQSLTNACLNAVSLESSTVETLESPC